MTDALDLFLELARDPEPAGRGARGRRPRHRGARATRARRRRGRRRPARSARRTGNLLCAPRRRRATAATPLFLCAHLDTVPPDGPIEPVVEDGVVRNAGRHDPRRRQQGRRRGDARGGAADRRATAARTRASSCSSRRRRRSACSARRPSTTRGSRARVGYVYDQAAPIGEVILGAPSAHAIDVALPRPRGALRACTPRRAARRSPRRRARSPTSGSAASTTRRPRTSARSRGGTARNIVPEWCVVRGRGALARRRASSPTLVQEMLDDVRVRGRASPSARVETEVQRDVPRATASGADDLAVRLAARRARALRATSRATALTGGGADANVFNERGLAVPQPRERHGGRSTRRTSTSPSTISSGWSR